MAFAASSCQGSAWETILFCLYSAIQKQRRIGEIRGKNSRISDIIVVGKLFTKIFSKKITVKTILFFAKGWWVSCCQKLYDSRGRRIAVSEEYLSRGMSCNKKAKNPIAVYIGSALEKFDAGVKQYAEIIEKPTDEIWLTYDLWKYAAIMMAASVFGNLIMWISVPKYIKKVSRIHPFDGLKEICLFFLPSIAIQVYTILDKSMIGIIKKSDYAIGCYEQSERIARLAITVVTSVGTVVLPRVANLYHNHNMEEAKRYVYLAFRVVWMISLPIMFGLIAVASVFIPLFLGNGFDDSIMLLCIFSLLILAVSLAYIVGLSYLIPTNQQNIYTVAVTIAACVNFLLNIILIPKFSAFGAAIASVIAEFVGTILQLLYCISKKQLDAKLIFAPSLKYIVSSAIMHVVVIAIKQKINNGLFSLCILVVSGMLVYTIGLFVLRDSFFLYNVKKVMNKFTKALHR